MARNERTSRRGEARRLGISQRDVAARRRRVGGLQDAGTASFEGGEELAQVLRALPGAIESAVLDQSTRAGAKVLQQGMERRRQARGWNLGGGFYVKKNRERSRPEGRSSYRIAPASEGYHALFLELGTVKMPAQPLMRPTVDAERSATVQAIVNKARKGVLRESAKLAGEFGALGKTRKRRLAR